MPTSGSLLLTPTVPGQDPHYVFPDYSNCCNSGLPTFSISLLLSILLTATRVIFLKIQIIIQIGTFFCLITSILLTYFKILTTSMARPVYLLNLKSYPDLPPRTQRLGCAYSEYTMHSRGPVPLLMLLPLPTTPFPSLAVSENSYSSFKANLKQQLLHKMQISPILQPQDIYKYL